MCECVFVCVRVLNYCDLLIKICSEKFGIKIRAQSSRGVLASNQTQSNQLFNNNNDVDDMDDVQMYIISYYGAAFEMIHANDCTGFEHF